MTDGLLLPLLMFLGWLLIFGLGLLLDAGRRLIGR